MDELSVKKKIVGFFYQNRDGFVSGEDISSALGFSRAYVWKYIQKLKNDGYMIEAVPHLGYRLRSIPDRMYGYSIKYGLDTKVFGKDTIYYYKSVGSTNDTAYELAEKGAPEGVVVIAETQTSGKGRMSRKWVSPKYSGIYMSIVLRPSLEADEAPALTLISATAISKAIREVCKLEAKVKWPNDVLINDKKVCGILMEMKAEPDSIDFLILGIGVNVNTSPREIPHGGTSLRIESSSKVDRLELVKNILEEFEKNYSVFKKEGFSSLREESKKLSTILGKHVKILEHNQAIEGQALDIDQKGSLIIRKDDGSLDRIFSGDVLLCR